MTASKLQFRPSPTRANTPAMPAIETLGLVAIIIMVGSYALEERSSVFIATFAFGCLLAAFYAYLIGSYPFLIAEGIWAVIAVRRWMKARAQGR